MDEQVVPDWGAAPLVPAPVLAQPAAAAAPHTLMHPALMHPAPSHARAGPLKRKAEDALAPAASTGLAAQLPFVAGAHTLWPQQAAWPAKVPAKHQQQPLFAAAPMLFALDPKLTSTAVSQHLPSAPADALVPGVDEFAALDAAAAATTTTAEQFALPLPGALPVTVPPIAYEKPQLAYDKPVALLPQQQQSQAVLKTPDAKKFYDHPDNEVRKRPRWETPRRRGEWNEAWECAKEIGIEPISATFANLTCAAVRQLLARVIVMSTGLARPTVDKWLQLLTEFLEMNVDEHVILLCLLQKYLSAGNSLQSDFQFQRPQKWECVIGMGCYFSVMLSEEFPGRTAMDLRDLLGGNFRFGREQIKFLKAVNWQVNVSAEQFCAARDLATEFAQSHGFSDKKVMSWIGMNLMDFAAIQAGQPFAALHTPSCDNEVPDVPL